MMFVPITKASELPRRVRKNDLPRFGRFMEPDPLGYEDSPNLYAYVLNDPINFVDPTGTRVVWIPRYACVGPAEGALSCGWTGYYTWEPDRGSPSGGGGFSGGGAGGGGGGGDGDVERKVSPCMQGFLKRHGYGAPNLGDITFRRGAQGSLRAKIAFGLGYPAITLGNNVYVAPSAWGRFQPGTSGFFEETIHSIQWSQSGTASFLGAYFSGGGAALLLTGDAHDNPVELEAIAISKRLEREYANERNRCR